MTTNVAINGFKLWGRFGKLKREKENEKEKSNSSWSVDNTAGGKKCQSKHKFIFTLASASIRQRQMLIDELMGDIECCVHEILYYCFDT